MNKLLVTTALVASTFASTSIASDLRNVFFGANGGRRVIESTVTEGNVTTFTVVTHKANGNQVTRTFTATATDGGFDISGNGKEGFKDFLSQHAAKAQAVEVEVSEYTLNNQLAFEAWQAERVATLTASGSIFVDSFARMEYNPNVNWIEVTEENDIAWQTEIMPLTDYVLYDGQGRPEDSTVSYLHTLNNQGPYRETTYNQVKNDDGEYCRIAIGQIQCQFTWDTNGARNNYSNIRYEDGVVKATRTRTEITGPAVLELIPGQDYYKHWVWPTEDIVEEVIVPLGYQSLLHVHFTQAHLDGVTGEGVKIGVVDVGNDTSLESYLLHGDHTDDIIKYFAPGVETTRVHNVSDYSGQHRVHLGYAGRYNYDWSDFDIINYSHGSTFSQGLSNYYGNIFAEAEDISNTLVTVAAGNDGSACATINTCNGAAHALTNVSPETVIVVGSANEAGTGLKGYSNRAGILKDNFLATSAVPLYYGYNKQGTSFAAPTAAAAAALVMDKFDTNAAETVDILFNTAIDIGAPGVDDVFGHGLLDLQAALSPIGSLN